MSFGCEHVVAKPTLLWRGGTPLLGALSYVWEFAQLFCRSLVSLFGVLGPYLTRHVAQPTPRRVRRLAPYRICRPVGHCLLKLTVVLDLDETLVLSCPRQKLTQPLRRTVSNGHLRSFSLTCDVGKGQRENLIVFLRPGLLEFLYKLSTFSDVVLFSAALGSYGNPLLDNLDPDRRVFSRRLFRESTVQTGVHRYVKDLTKLRCDLRRTVIVDDRACSFLLQPRNGIRCKPFRGNAQDRELKTVILPILEELSCLPDVRPTLHTTFGMETWFQSKGLVM